MAAEEALQLVDHEAEEAWPTGSGDTRDVRTHEHIGEIPNRTRRGNRLGIEDIDRHADVTSTRTRDQRLRIDDGAARDVDEYGVRFEQIQLALADHALRQKAVR